MHSVDNRLTPPFLAKSHQPYNEFEMKYHEQHELVWDFALDGTLSKSVPPVPEDVRRTDYLALITELALQFNAPNVDAGPRTLGVCAYCERLCVDNGGSRHNEVDHFRPRSSHNWLTFDWINLMYACRGCNRRKDDEKVSNEVDQLGFVNPREPTAEDYFAFDLGTGAVIVRPNLTDSGKIDIADRTIKAFGLDRTDINELRVAHLQLLNRDLSEKGTDGRAKRRLLNLYKRRKMPFSSLVRYAEVTGHFNI